MPFVFDDKAALADNLAAYAAELEHLHPVLGPVLADRLQECVDGVDASVILEELLFALSNVEE
ncbi:hypothetical protein SSBR45G_19520 [Bradyrhizobium sp. SSBR45G]|uniref:hypothetical protein n=1 Tax=unclassified Bradyrhizobium TaxID=2631580 RepID=UPI0023428CD3|nr:MULTISPECIES: hypothetical protein [unclassified Bradyrhizobium]GLH77044.1 hypothetical protein SSBR45G_19520 [Bradyrhizobium sp. SSBR45G]GLH83802.1 hypothetical protein SSBR45R_12620 [Bradyrhizobium sp. SSBR45R]